MEKACILLLCGWIISLAEFQSVAWAETMPSNEDFIAPNRPMQMECVYSEYTSFQIESILVSQNTKNSGVGASVYKFLKSSENNDLKTFIIRPGQFAECIYPSGTKVRVKVGEDHARPYGLCGGDPEVFMSLWVNERKIASNVWFTGHCREDQDNPDVSFKITKVQGLSIQKCHTSYQQEDRETQENEDGAEKPTTPLSVCIDYPDISNFPKDEREYPSKKEEQSLKIGDIELVNGTEAVCQVSLEELKSDFSAFEKKTNISSSKLNRINWEKSELNLPEELQFSYESIFDFDNDGKLDRVLIRHFQTNYMDSSILLIQTGESETELNVPDSPMAETSILLPCQMDNSRPDIRKCPPFSQESDDAGFTVSGKSEKDSVHFRARYSNLTPFIFQGVNYLGVSSKSADTENYVAILKPLPKGKIQEMCLFRKIEENF